jgi:hypothetical protein
MVKDEEGRGEGGVVESDCPLTSAVTADLACASEGSGLCAELTHGFLATLAGLVLQVARLKQRAVGWAPAYGTQQPRSRSNKGQTTSRQHALVLKQ